MRPKWNIATVRGWRCCGSCSGAAAREISGLKPEIAKLLEPFAEAERKEDEQRRAKESTIDSIGKLAVDLVRDLYEQISLLGQVAVISLRVARPAA